MNALLAALILAVASTVRLEMDGDVRGGDDGVGGAKDTRRARAAKERTTRDDAVGIEPDVVARGRFGRSATFATEGSKGSRRVERRAGRPDCRASSPHGLAGARAL